MCPSGSFKPETIEGKAMRFAEDKVHHRKSSASSFTAHFFAHTYLDNRDKPK